MIFCTILLLISAQINQITGTDPIDTTNSISGIIANSTETDPTVGTKTIVIGTTNQTEDEKTDGNKDAKPNLTSYCLPNKEECKLICDCPESKDCDVLELNEDVQNGILNALNLARANLTTKNEFKASGMSIIYYDNELEEISKCWSARCENKTTDCFITPNFNETTQIIGTLPFDSELFKNETAENYWDRIIQKWIDEIGLPTNSTNLTEIDTNSTPETGILSDRLRSVGCSWSRTNSTIEEMSSLNFVCTFGLSGAENESVLFRIGDLCTTCPFGYKCDNKEPYEFLCKNETLLSRNDDETEDNGSGEQFAETSTFEGGLRSFHEMTSYGFIICPDNFSIIFLYIFSKCFN